MKIRTKLLIGFGSLMLILLVLTFISYDRMDFLKKQVDQVYEQRYVKVRNSSDMRGQVNEMTKEMANALLNTDIAVNDVKADLNSARDKADKNLNSLLKSQSTSDEKLTLNNVQKVWDKYKIYVDTQISLLEQGDRAKSMAYRKSTGIEIQNEIIESLNSLLDYQDLEIEQEVKDADVAYQNSVRITVLVMALGLLLALGVMLWLLPSINRGLNTVNLMMNSFGKGKLKAIRRIKVTTDDEIGEVARVFQSMSEDLEQKQEMEQKYTQAQQDSTWVNANLARITELFRGANSLKQVCQLFINEFTPVLGGRYGAIYIREAEKNPNEIRLTGAYAMDEANRPHSIFRMGEGLVGQVAADQTALNLKEVPENYLSVRSGLGESKPADVMIYPIVFEEEAIGVVEIAAFHPFTPIQMQLLQELTGSLGVILTSIMGRIRVEELLRESQAQGEELQAQSEELQTQQEELRRSNENLEEQTIALKRSEELLQRQQEELEHFNTELIAKTHALQEQVQEVEEKNDEIQKTKTRLEEQARQLELTSKYKSEFLANMSHELRTPLNSLLILSQLLSENKENNLSTKQKEYAQTIYMSGADLLKMIDEILDLSKVDAGKMEINREELHMDELRKFVLQNFQEVAHKKNLVLGVEVDSDVPEIMVTDGHRVKQILRNLLSNAFKFTSQGQVTFEVSRAHADDLPYALDATRSYLALAVRDTGIGISKDKTDLIFEAFQQADGTTSRKYGGTGLGLSISRGLANLLGGAIHLTTTEGEGSKFTLYLPESSLVMNKVNKMERESLLTADPVFRERTKTQIAATSSRTIIPMIEDDRADIQSQDKVLLIVEDDIHFARILIDMARGYGFKTLTSAQGDEGLKMAKSYLPDAIILDIQLPVMDGWSILAELKGNPDTRHIPVHVISVVDDVKQGMMMGAIAYLQKPSSREGLEQAFNHIESYIEKSLKHLLIVEDDEIQRKAIIELVGHDDVMITAVSTGQEAIHELAKQHFDCMVLDLMLTDMTGFTLLDQIRDDENLRDLPIIIYTGKELNNKEETQLRKYAESIIIKDVKSPERLLDETTLFLHRVEADLPEEKRSILRKLHNKEELFEGKKILLVDDDVRNVFALSSVLEGYRMNVVFAENGREAIDTLVEHGDFDLILMDMMMPEMDGYEAMTLIRQMPEYEKLPIIALTAKAMKDDRFKCIEAGASDYMKKPIQTDQLLSLMRVWLYS
ncbi:CheY-like chemotaxis protein/HAMP domain-containing protein [Paenibacillus shirakamiensis]|uniref:histidine kinase n=1 Tax=Paenibacillus shirakamiensis TaxID=1265935 RepID=A0ABS4JL66_9BACL|nr:response regulator [Paenibacillus shirakamiensis]MBP2002459.1 CheY-like chemotaxis protein/HAMP domain-containing protein [Paenibacillus shirakamiensis]